MTPILGSPALRLLARRKLRATLRVQLQRLRRPSGVLLGLFGLLLFVGWIVGLQQARSLQPDVDPERLVRLVRLGALFITVFSLGSSVTHRGLFLPAEEVERLLSAPVSRADIVRYRLLANAGRTLPAGLVFGVILMGKMPQPAWALLGAFAALQVLPVVGQAAAILAGALERSSVERLRGWPGGIVRLAALLLALAVFLLLVLGGGRGGGIGELLDLAGPHRAEALMDDVLHHPAVSLLTLPFEPWARAITAPDAVTFAAWFPVCIVVWVLLFEVTARLPIDFRELSLETSASVAERIRRHRRAGGGASAASVSKLAVSWRAPWLLGRGPMGAIAWRKAVGIVRKARGTLLVSVFVLALVTLFVGSMAGVPDDAGLFASVMIGAVGTFYMVGGLRFDFREELDRMESIKSWPLSPWRVFAATILPETLLVSGLLGAAILLRAVATSTLEPRIAGVLAALPLFVFSWVALDNAVFLVFPVRLVPGQEGALQNMGRAVLLVFLRMVLFAVVGGGVALGAAAGWYGAQVAGAAGSVQLAAACVLGWLALLLAACVLAAVGGVLFRRFDVARLPG